MSARAGQVAREAGDCRARRGVGARAAQAGAARALQRVLEDAFHAHRADDRRVDAVSVLGTLRDLEVLGEHAGEHVLALVEQ